MDGSLSATVAAYAQAKSRQDVEGALSYCSDDFLLYTKAFQSTARGKAATRRQLKIFFRAFPDYSVVLHQGHSNAAGYACSGELIMSLSGQFGPFSATGKTAKLEFFCVFTGQKDQITSEHFFFSDEELCAQLGLPVVKFRRSMNLAAKLPTALLAMF